MTPFFAAKRPSLLMTGVALGLASAACGSSATTSVSPSPVAKCQVNVTGGQLAIDAAGGPGALTVSALAECGWTVEAAANWISGVTPPSGQGNGEIKFQVAPNPNSAPRQGDISLNGTAVKVTQAGASCQVQIASSRQTVPANGATGTLTVTAPDGCDWTVNSSASWLTAAASGTGTGTVTFAATANGGDVRTATLTVGNRIFVVTQLGLGESCTYTIQQDEVSIDAAGGRATVTVQAEANCSWTATSNASWVTVEGSGTGSGSASLTIRVSANTGALRTASVTIADQTFTVTQGGACVTTIDPTSQSAPAAGGAGTPVTVTAPPGCRWTATTSASWLTVTSGTSGSGNGTVGFNVAANTGVTRTGTIRIGTNTFTLAQAAPAACSYSISPTEQTFEDKPATSEPVSVTSAAGCAWTATSNDDWITVRSGESGSGNGTVTFSVSRNNTSGPRVGTLTIAGRTFTVTQTRH